MATATVKEIAMKIRDWTDNQQPGEPITSEDLKGLRRVATELERIEENAIAEMAKGPGKKQAGFFDTIFGTDEEDVEEPPSE